MKAGRTWVSLRDAMAVYVIVFLVFCAVSAFADDVSGDKLRIARSAAEDGLYALAEKQIVSFLDESKGDGQSVEREEAFRLFVQSLYEQDKYDDMLRTAKARRKWKLGKDEVGGDVFWSALARYGKGDYDRALKELKNFENDYSDPYFVQRVLRLRGWCLLAKGDPVAAAERFGEFERAFPESPLSAENLLDLSKARIASGLSDEARRSLRKLVTLSPDDGNVQEGFYWLGRLLFEAGRADEASDMLKKLAENESVRRETRAMAWLECGKVDEAREKSVEAESDYRNAMDLARDIVLKQEAGIKLGALLLSGDRLDDAMSILSGAIAMSPSTAIAESAQMKLSMFLFEHGKMDEAIEAFQHYLETYTNSVGIAEANYGKGRALMKVKRYAEAASALGRARDEFSDQARKMECLFGMGDAYFANGQYELAEKTYGEVIIGKPGEALVSRAMFQLGETLARRGDHAKAIVTWKDLIRQYPSSGITDMALMRVAASEEAMENWQTALETYQKVMDDFPNGSFFADALLGRGMVRYHLFQYDKAAADFEELLNRFSASSSAEKAMYMLGVCCYWLGEDEKQLSAWKKFFELYPDSEWAPRVLFWMGQRDYNMGDFEKAEKVLLGFYDKYPKDDLSDDALFWAARSLLKRREYKRSIELLTRMVKEYPESSKIAEARFAQAAAFRELAQVAEAILILDEVINNYPDSDLVAEAWARKGDCHFALGSDDPKRYEEAIKCYKVAVNHVKADRDLVISSQYMIGSCLEKQGKQEEALEQYYEHVLMFFTVGQEKGVRHTEEEKIWFIRASVRVADMLEARQEYRRMVKILDRVVNSGVPGVEEFKTRAEKVRSEHWWLFY